MSKAPKEIWCSSGLYPEYDNEWLDGEWHSYAHPDDVKYVRADHIEELVQEAVKEALEKAAKYCTAQLRNTEMLLSSPPQSAAAWYARTAILALAERGGKDND